MSTFYAVMSGALVRDGLHEERWQAGMYLESTDPTVFNAHAAFTAATEALWNGTGSPDDGLVKAYSNLVKLQRIQTYDFAPTIGRKGITLSAVEDIPGEGIVGALPPELAVLVTLYGAPEVRSIGKLYLPPVDIGHCGPFGDLNFHAAIVVPASLALFFGSLATNGYVPALYRRPQRDVVPVAEYTFSARMRWVASRGDTRTESRTRVVL